MEKLQLPKLKIESPQDCDFILNLYQKYAKEAIRQIEKYYIQKIDYLWTINCPKEIIWKYDDRLDLSIYVEERRAYEEFVENFDYYNNDNNLDQFDIGYKI